MVQLAAVRSLANDLPSNCYGHKLKMQSKLQNSPKIARFNRSYGMAYPLKTAFYPLFVRPRRTTHSFWRFRL